MFLFYKALGHLSARQIICRLQLKLKGLLFKKFGYKVVPKYFAKNNNVRQKFNKNVNLIQSSHTEKQNFLTNDRLGTQNLFSLINNSGEYIYQKRDLSKLESFYHSFLISTALDFTAKKNLLLYYIGKYKKRLYDTNQEWHPYAVSNRIINWTTFLYDNFEHLSKWEISLITHELNQMCDFLMWMLEYDILANHLLKNYIALIYYNVLFQKSSIEFLTNPFKNQLTKQFFADGGHYERCPMYHCKLLTDLKLISKQLPKDENLKQQIDSVIHRGSNWIQNIIISESRLPNFGDSWSIFKHNSLFDYKTVPEDLYSALIHSGFYRLGYKSKWGVIITASTASPRFNPSHSHNDYLSCEIAHDGENLIVDPGVSSYSCSEERIFSRSELSHNGPCVYGSQMNEIFDTFRFGKINKCNGKLTKQDENIHFFRGSYVNCDQIECERSVTVNQSKCLISDKWEHRTNRKFSKRTKYHTRWLLNIKLKQMEILSINNVNLKLRIRFGKTNKSILFSISSDNHSNWEFSFSESYYYDKFAVPTHCVEVRAMSGEQKTAILNTTFEYLI